LEKNPKKELDKSLQVYIRSNLIVTLIGDNMNAVAPGWVRTELIAHLIEDKEMLQRYLRSIPIRRLGEPEEIGPLVAYLCSDLSSFMTGSVVVIDGGLMIP
jgi:NAD(P)-dependent dehydrogenase (short-subunit alcohol dehydrogenase family)